MNVKDLENRLVADFPHLKRDTVRAALNVILAQIRAALKEDIPVKLHYFGKFERRLKKTAPMTWLGDKDPGGYVKTVAFTPSRLLLEYINAANLDYNEPSFEHGLQHLDCPEE